MPFEIVTDQLAESHKTEVYNDENVNPILDTKSKGTSEVSSFFTQESTVSKMSTADENFVQFMEDKHAEIMRKIEKLKKTSR